MRKPILLIFLFLCGLARGQDQSVIDSLSRFLNIDLSDPRLNDQLRIQLLDRTFFTYLNADSKKARACAKLQIELARKINYQAGVGGGMMNLGTLARQEGDLEEAMKFYLACLNIKEFAQMEIANLYINIAIVYGEMKDYAKALEYDLRSLKIHRQKMDTTTKAEKKTLAIIYNNIGMDHFMLGDHERSLKYYLAGLAISVAEKNKESMAVLYNNIGNNYIHLKQFDKAKEMFLVSLDLAEEINSLGDIAEVNVSLGTLNNHSGEFTKAIPFFEKALDLSYQLGDKPQRLLIYKKMTDSYDGLKDYKNKSIYLARQIELNDSIMGEERSRQITALHTRFETEEKEKENIILSNKNQIQALQLSQKNYLTLGLSLMILALIIIGWVLFKQHRSKAEQKAVLLEQKLLRSQMNPHFIFNSLATIESFIYENQPKEAGRYLSDFARLMRLILENSAEEYISLEKEIKMLDYYLTLQRLRLENTLQYAITVDDAIDPEEVSIPPMLTQPFIENAIEHGFRGSKLAGNIQISFKKINDTIVVEVSDNGIGINQASSNKEKQSEHRSMALQITKERLAALNRSRGGKKRKLSFSISDISGDTRKTTGTRVIFSFPA